MRRSWGWRETYGSDDDDVGFAGDGGKGQVRQVVKGAQLEGSVSCNPCENG